MPDSKITIIIPVYKVEKYIHQCIDSVIDQSYKNLEIILVDDGSPDKCPEICDDYAKKDKRIKVIHQENQGLSSARNTGIKASTGDYINFIDSDDWIEREAFQIALDTRNRWDADLVMWPYIREYENRSLKKEIFPQDLIVYEEEDLKKKLHRRILGLLGEELARPEDADAIVTVSNKLYKAEIIKKHKIEFVDTEIIGTEDALFNLYVFGKLKRAVYTKDYLYHYRKDNLNSLTRQYKGQLKEQWDNLFDLMEEYIQENKLDRDYTQALDNRISMSIIGLGLKEVESKHSRRIQIKEIKKILTAPRYRKACKTLELRYFPLHWKIFFLLAKKNFAPGVYLMLVAIKIIK